MAAAYILLLNGSINILLENKTRNMSDRTYQPNAMVNPKFAEFIYKKTLCDEFLSLRF